MKRLAFFGFLVVFPVALFAASTQRYIVMTEHPFETAVRAMRNDDFDPAARHEAHVREFKVINGFAADLTDAQVAALLRSGEVQDIEPVLQRRVLADSVTAGQQTTPFGISMVNAPAVWPVTKGAAINGTGPIHVAIIDTGIDYNNPALGGGWGKRVIAGGQESIIDVPQRGEGSPALGGSRGYPVDMGSLSQRRRRLRNFFQ